MRPDEDKSAILPSRQVQDDVLVLSPAMREGVEPDLATTRKFPTDVSFDVSMARRRAVRIALAGNLSQISNEPAMQLQGGRLGFAQSWMGLHPEGFLRIGRDRE
jgi:hypothetical protein